MANGIYDLAREAFLEGGIDMSGDDIKVALVRDDDYTANLAIDEFLDDIPGGAVVDTSGNLSGKTVAAGVFDAIDISFTAVPADDPCVLVIYQDTGNAATSRLIAYLDTGTGLPVTPNDNDINVTWSGGASRIFKL